VIISDTHKLVFITTPKSGSHTGFKLMTDYFNASAGFNHNLKVPNICKNYRIFTFVRNPYERFCSLYHACVINDEKKFVPSKAKRSILDYAIWLAKCKRTEMYPRIDLCAPQHIWHRTSSVKEFIQIEKAQEFFNNLFPELNIKIPHELKREHPTWDNVITDTLKYYVDIWAGRDFYLYGY